MRDGAVDAVDEGVGADGDANGREDEDYACGPGVELEGSFGLVVAAGSEDLGVGFELEEEVEAVEEEQNDGCDVGEG